MRGRAMAAEKLVGAMGGHRARAADGTADGRLYHCAAALASNYVVAADRCRGVRCSRAPASGAPELAAQALIPLAEGALAQRRRCVARPTA